MKQWPVIVVVAGTLASQEIKHQDADLHTHQETQGGMDQPIGRAAFEAVVTTGTMRPFVTQMDGNEFRRHRPDGWYYDQQQMPLTLRALSVIR
jgi:hypothetical protein